MHVHAHIHTATRMRANARTHTLSHTHEHCCQAHGGKGGLLGLKEEKHSGEQMVVSVNRNHELYTEFRCVGWRNTFRETVLVNSQYLYS